MKEIEIGRLLRAGTTGFVVGCSVNQLDAPSFGALVRVPLENDYQVYGLIYDMRIDDDGLVRQLVTAQQMDENIIADNRHNRNVPLEMSVLCVGYQLDGSTYHRLPPRPPFSLDVILNPSERVDSSSLSPWIRAWVIVFLASFSSVFFSSVLMYSTDSMVTFLPHRIFDNLKCSSAVSVHPC